MHLFWGWLTIHWPICSTWWMWVPDDSTMQIWGLLDLTAKFILVSLSVMASGGPCQLPPWGIGFRKDYLQGSQFRPLATGCLRQEKVVRFLLFSLPPALPFSQAVSEPTYLFHFHFAFLLPSLFIAGSFSFAPVFQSVSPLISSFLFLFVIWSFFLYFPHIPVSLTLLLDLYGRVSWP